MAMSIIADVRCCQRGWVIFCALAHILRTNNVVLITFLVVKMKGPIKDGRSEYAGIVEDLRPVFEGFIGGRNQGALVIGKADDLEQGVCSCFVEFGDLLK